MQQVKWAFIFFVVIVVQSSFVQLIAIHDIRPDLLIIILIFYSFQCGQTKATVMGFFVGLVQDILTGGVLGASERALGLSSFTKSVSGFLSGFSSKKDRPRTAKSFIITLLVVTLVHNVLFYSLYTIGEGMSSFDLAVYRIIPSSLYTILIGILLYSMKTTYK